MTIDDQSRGSKDVFIQHLSVEFPESIYDRRKNCLRCSFTTAVNITSLFAYIILHVSDHC